MSVDNSYTSVKIEYTIVYPDGDLGLLPVNTFEDALDTLRIEQEKETQGDMRGFAGAYLLATVTESTKVEVEITGDIEDEEALIAKAGFGDDPEPPTPAAPAAKAPAKPKAA